MHTYAHQSKPIHVSTYCFLRVCMCVCVCVCACARAHISLRKKRELISFYICVFDFDSMLDTYVNLHQSRNQTRRQPKTIVHMKIFLYVLVSFIVSFVCTKDVDLRIGFPLRGSTIMTTLKKDHFSFLFLFNLLNLK